MQYVWASLSMLLYWISAVVRILFANTIGYSTVFWVLHFLETAFHPSCAEDLL